MSVNGFKLYMSNKKNKSEKTVKNYTRALKTIEKLLLKMNVFPRSFEEIHNIELFIIIETLLKKNDEFKTINKRGHYMYSAALSQYKDYLTDRASGKYSEAINPLLANHMSTKSIIHLLPEPEFIPFNIALMENGIFTAEHLKEMNLDEFIFKNNICKFCKISEYAAKIEKRLQSMIILPYAQPIVKTKTVITKSVLEEKNSNIPVNIDESTEINTKDEQQEFVFKTSESYEPLLNRAKEYIERKKFNNEQSICQNILDRYFSHGIHLDSFIDINKFKERLKSEEVHVSLYNDESIRTAIKLCTVLIDDDLRMSPGNLKIERVLLENIIDFVIRIVSVQNGFLSSEVLYEEFKSKLLYTNIYSTAMLNNVIKFYMGNGVMILNGIITQVGKMELNTESLIVDYLKNKQFAVEKTELIQKFAGIAPREIEKVLNKNLAVIGLSYDMFLHADNVLLDESCISELINTLLKETQKGFTTIKNLIPVLKKKFPTLIVDNDFANDKQILKYLKYINNGELQFKYNFVGRPNQTLSGVEAVLGYLEDKDTFTFSELQEFVESNGLPELYYIFLNHIGERYVRVNKEKFVSVSSFNITLEDIEEIENSLFGYMDKKYLPVQKIDSFIFLPTIKYRWNEFLLESVVRLFCKTLGVINYYHGIKKARGVFVKKGFGIEDRESLLLTAAIDSNSIYPFSSESEMLKFWLEEKLLSSARYSQLSTIYRKVKGLEDV